MSDESAVSDSGTETQGDSATATATGSGSEAGNSLEELLNGLDESTRKVILGEVSKARGEAAKYRTEKRELEPLAEEAKTLREAAKSDIEKLTERLSAAEKAAASRELDLARRDAVIKHGLTLDDVRFLNGSTADEIAEQAEQFAARLGVGNVLGGKPREALKGGAGRDEEVDPYDTQDPEKLAALILAKQYG